MEVWRLATVHEGGDDSDDGSVDEMGPDLTTEGLPVSRASFARSVLVEDGVNATVVGGWLRSRPARLHPESAVRHAHMAWSKPSV